MGKVKCKMVKCMSMFKITYCIVMTNKCTVYECHLIQPNSLTVINVLMEPKETEPHD